MLNSLKSINNNNVEESTILPHYLARPFRLPCYLASLANSAVTPASPNQWSATVVHCMPPTALTSGDVASSDWIRRQCLLPVVHSD